MNSTRVKSEEKQVTMTPLNKKLLTMLDDIGEFMLGEKALTLINTEENLKAILVSLNEPLHEDVENKLLIVLQTYISKGYSPFSDIMTLQEYESGIILFTKILIKPKLNNDQIEKVLLPKLITKMSNPQQSVSVKLILRNTPIYQTKSPAKTTVDEPLAKTTQSSFASS